MMSGNSAVTDDKLHDRDGTARQRIPDAINDFVEGLREFEVARGGTNEGTPAIKAERDDASITVSRTLDDQWWLVGEANGVRPISEMYESPECVVVAATEWLNGIEN